MNINISITDEETRETRRQPVFRVIQEETQVRTVNRARKSNRALNGLKTVENRNGLSESDVNRIADAVTQRIARMIVAGAFAYEKEES